MCSKLYNFKGEKQISDVRPMVKKLAAEIGFDNNNSVNISSTISELMQYVSALSRDFNVSIRIVQSSKNTGIEFIINAITDHQIRTRFSINGHLGSGFENIKRRMDNFCISSSGGEFKLVTRKWIPAA